MGELLRRISSRELSEWMAYEKIAGPLGGARDDVLAALVSATIANANRAKGPTYQVKKFIPVWEPPPAQSPMDLYEKARQINAALGGSKIGGE